MKTIITALFIVYLVHIANAQYTLLSTALNNPVSLTFPVSVISPASVAYHPTAHVYYTARCGLTTYPLCTFSSTGTLLLNTTAGQDTRGIWWNSNTNQLERNCFSSIGWGAITLDVNKYATSSFTVIFSGMMQPDVQSIGAYDPVNNEVIYYFSGAVHRYNRTTGAFISSTTLTGVSLTTVNTNTVIYTGVTGYEYGLLDWSAKKILLFNKSTGVFAGSSQLPASAITNSMYKFSYANDMIWLFNSTLSKWNSYIIWDVSLPVHSLVATGYTEEMNNIIHWDIVSDSPVDHYEVEYSKSGNDFTTIASVPETQNDLIHPHPYYVHNYYRVIAVDKDDKRFASDIICIDNSSIPESIFVYPNPGINDISVSAPETGAIYSITDNTGREIENNRLESTGMIDIHTLSPGIYYLNVSGKNARFVKE